MPKSKEYDEAYISLGLQLDLEKHVAYCMEMGYFLASYPAVQLKRVEGEKWRWYAYTSE